MHHLSFLTPAGAVLFAVGDPERDRTVYAAIVLLVALGFTTIMLAAWLFRNTRPDPEVLAPLERMGERKWRRADPVWQRRRLDQVRPGGADPLEPTSAPPATDAEFERGPQPIGFDDLVVSSPATVAIASELPAPSAGTIVADGPALNGGDVSADPDAVELGTPPDPMTAVDGAANGSDADAAREVSESEADNAEDEDESPGDPDDDEDITGEQDTDDFFAALGSTTDGDTDGEIEADMDGEVDTDGEAGEDGGADTDGDAGEDVGVEAAGAEDDESA